MTYLQPRGKVAGHNYYGILELSVDFRCQFGVDEFSDRYESPLMDNFRKYIYFSQYRLLVLLNAGVESVPVAVEGMQDS